MKTTKFYLLLLCITLLFSACTVETETNNPLPGNQIWWLTSYNEMAPISGAPATIQFESGQVSGTTGCNHYGGQYQIKQDQLQLLDLYQTEMACLTPEGLMEQEQSYLALLRDVETFQATDAELVLRTSTGQELRYTNTEPAVAEPVSTTVVIEPTSTTAVTQPAAFEPPAGFIPYLDEETGISIYLPETWVVSASMPGQSAIFQSYPIDKYIGGEAREEGDTKCDLTLHPADTTTDEWVAQWEADERTTILNDETIIIRDGISARRLEIDSMGRAITYLVELQGHPVVLTCFGDFSQVDQIAAMLGADK